MYRGIILNFFVLHFLQNYQLYPNVILAYIFFLVATANINELILVFLRKYLSFVGKYLIFFPKDVDSCLVFS